MGTPWEPDDQEEYWSDREAWRGEQHIETIDVDAWRESGEAGWVWAEPEPAAEEDWPEHLAGPEYWLFKKYGS